MPCQIVYHRISWVFTIFKQGVLYGKITNQFLLQFYMRDSSAELDRIGWEPIHPLMPIKPGWCEEILAHWACHNIGIQIY